MRHSRRGALTLETAIVLPVMFLLLFTLVVGGMGVFRYQQVACQAREAARWACVRGCDWSAETGKESPTKEAIFRRAIWPHAAGMSRDAFAVEVDWIDQNTGEQVDWDEATKSPRSVTASNQVIANSVRVTVTYDWTPRLLWFGSLKLRSISELPMSF